jgi:hypothetical protein
LNVTSKQTYTNIYFINLHPKTDRRRETKGKRKERKKQPRYEQ